MVSPYRLVKLSWATIDGLYCRAMAPNGGLSVLKRSSRPGRAARSGVFLYTRCLELNLCVRYRSDVKDCNYYRYTYLLMHNLYDADYVTSFRQPSMYHAGHTFKFKIRSRLSLIDHDSSQWTSSALETTCLMDLFVLHLSIQ